MYASSTGIGAAQHHTGLHHCAGNPEPGPRPLGVCTHQGVLRGVFLKLAVVAHAERVKPRRSQYAQNSG